MTTMLAPPTVINTEHHMLTPVANKMEDLSISPRTKKKQADEPIAVAYSQILDQSKKRLNSLDAQRLVSVVEESAHKCEVVTLLPFVIENLQRFSVTLGPELLTALTEYDHLQRMYMNALKNVRTSRPGSASRYSTSDFTVAVSGGSTSPTVAVVCDDLSKEYEVAVEAVGGLSASLSQSVRTIARLFKANPVAMNTMKVQRNERSYEANLLIFNLI